MNPAYFTQKFEKIVTSLFQLMDYDVKPNGRIGEIAKEIDIIAIGPTKHYIEVKFYRSSNIPFSTLQNASNDLAYYVNAHNDGSGILATNVVVDPLFKDRIKSEIGIDIWDKPTILSHLLMLSLQLKQEFEQLLLEAQQGTEPYKIYSGHDILEFVKINQVDGDFDIRKRSRKSLKPPEKKGIQLKEKLGKIKAGKDGWQEYEKLLFEILRFLFSNDLTLWEKQNRTDDSLSRFDLVCRINAFDDYWKTLIFSFNTRFVQWEFKNYSEKINQHQVYSTERYLYNKALRSVGFIVSRFGPDEGAIQAAKGALKENGKLIMFLNDGDLEAMLEAKDQNGNANDYLSDLLDLWLVGLSR